MALSPTDERALQLFRAYQAGTSIDYLRKKYGTTPQHINLLIVRGKRVALDLQNKNPALDLTVATRNALERYMRCDPTPQGVIAFFPKAQMFARVPSLGAKRIAEVQAWLVKHGHKEIL